MARTTEKVLVQLLADNKQFRQSLEQAQSSSKNLRDSISGPKGIGGSFAVVGRSASSLLPIMATVGTAIAGAFGLSKAVAAANKQEEAINSVATALARAGENVADVLPEMQKFASELQKNSTIGDEAALSMLALAQGFGASKDQAKLVVEASAELAAATGKSLTEAVRQVSKTLGGYAGELGEVNPAIKELTKEQLQAGQAATILIDQYGGTARSKLNTFSGAVTQSSNAFGDLLEEVGFLITKNPLVIRLVQASSEGFEKLGGFINRNAESLREGFNVALLSILDIVPGVLRAFGDLANGFDALGITGGSVGHTIKEVFIGLKVTLNSVLAGITTAVANFLNVVVNLGEKLDSVFGTNSAEKYKPLTEALFKIRDSLTAEVAQDLGFEVAIKKGVKKSTGYFDDLAKSVEDNLKGIRDAGSTTSLPQLSSGPISGQPHAAGGSSAGASSSAITKKEVTEGFEDAKIDLKDNVFDKFKDSFNASKLAELLSGAVQGFTKGDAKAVVSGVAGGVAGAAGTAILGPAGGALGGIVQSLVDVLAEGPDKVREMVEQFAENLPIILENIALAIPAFVDAFAEHADEIAKAIAKHSPQIAIELAMAFHDPVVLAEIARAIFLGMQEGTDNWLVKFNKDLIKVNANLNRVTGAFEEAIGAGVREWKRLTQNFLKSAIGSDLDALANNIASAFTRAFKPIEDFFNRIGGTIGKILPSNSSNQGQGFIAEKTGIKIPGLATGGLVGGEGGGDVNVFRLKRGELVTPDTTTKDLQSFLLDYKQGRGNQETLLNAILTELRRPQQISSEVNFDGRTLAEIMLKLDRQGQRLRA